MDDSYALQWRKGHWLRRRVDENSLISLDWDLPDLAPGTSLGNKPELGKQGSGSPVFVPPPSDPLCITFTRKSLAY
jgi:hypothetical protein